MSAQIQHLSHSFRTDAAHLIFKTRCASNPKAKGAPYPRTSYIAKLVVDAYMACECALKSMIASSNKTKSGADVYTIIRQCGHDLRCLMKQAKPLSISKDDRNFLKQASKRGVSFRYSFDLFSLTTCDFLPSDEVSFRLDPNYLAEFLRIADLLAKEANERHVRDLGTQIFFSSRQKLKSYVKSLRDITAKRK